jgi:hypothetical protein
MADNFYVFTNMKDTKLLAVTHDREGDNLPKGNGHWQYWKEFKGALSGRTAFGLSDVPAALVALEQQGYYLWKWPRLLKAA